MGVVYRAEDTFIERQVAVKLLRVRDASARERLRRRMRREVIIAGRLTHPHIVTLYDAGLDDEEMYLVMELVDGETLRRGLARDGALPQREAVAHRPAGARRRSAYAHRAGRRPPRPQAGERAAHRATAAGQGRRLRHRQAALARRRSPAGTPACSTG